MPFTHRNTCAGVCQSESPRATMPFMHRNTCWRVSEREHERATERHDEDERARYEESETEIYINIWTIVVTSSTQQKEGEEGHLRSFSPANERDVWLATSEQRGTNSQGFEDFYLEAKAMIWP